MLKHIIGSKQNKKKKLLIIMPFFRLDDDPKKDMQFKIIILNITQTQIN